MEKSFFVENENTLFEINRLRTICSLLLSGLSQIIFVETSGPDLQLLALVTKHLRAQAEIFREIFCFGCITKCPPRARFQQENETLKNTMWCFCLKLKIVSTKFALQNLRWHWDGIFLGSQIPCFLGIFQEMENPSIVPWNFIQDFFFNYLKLGLKFISGMENPTKSHSCPKW